MLFDVNIDKVDDILKIRESIIQGNFVDNGGFTIVSWTSEGVSVQKQWALPVRVLLEETKKYLQVYDPSLYGRRVTRTTPSYLF